MFLFYDAYCNSLLYLSLGEALYSKASIIKLAFLGETWNSNCAMAVGKHGPVLTVRGPQPAVQ